jgi:hypothetical protein
LNDSKQKTRQHQPHRNLGINPGTAILGAIEVGHFSAEPPKIKNLIYLHQHMVIRDQTPQRPGDEKFQLPAFFPTQHRNPSAAVQQSESETSDFFNTPHWTDF